MAITFQKHKLAKEWRAPWLRQGWNWRESFSSSG